MKLLNPQAYKNTPELLTKDSGMDITQINSLSAVANPLNLPIDPLEPASLNHLYPTSHAILPSLQSVESAAVNKNLMMMTPNTLNLPLSLAPTNSTPIDPMLGMVEDNEILKRPRVSLRWRIGFF